MSASRAFRRLDFIIRKAAKTAEAELDNTRALKTAADLDLVKLWGKKVELDKRHKQSGKFVANLNSSMDRLSGPDAHDDSGIDSGGPSNTDDVLLGVMKTAAQLYFNTGKKHGAAILGDDADTLSDKISEVKKRISQAEARVEEALLGKKTLVEMTKAKDSHERVRECRDPWAGILKPKETVSE
ncbi:hypothetical protein NW762_013369 [Fusarium torreyae]|uniref:Uncharacterized protein n=1 Tax=Fusarium torreyae TaxID=1237075 RepID=A0A9W8V7H1_9HYPO|nr:hypothetical protein NW762_013369 [Fusarium torreyae]